MKRKMLFDSSANMKYAMFLTDLFKLLIQPEICHIYKKVELN